MISYGVSVARACDDCEAEMVCELAQRIVHDRLHWTAECHCPHCGSTVAICGWDDTPDEIRDALVARYGLARLTVEDLTGCPPTAEKNLVALPTLERGQGPDRRSPDLSTEVQYLVLGHSHSHMSAIRVLSRVEKD
ncbi:hypothetical protein GA0074692_3353 [Micromonospora pallida]|uniref:Uncharacterized protein n=1 Tax=Micromonospora pallida TaxID=145854 RepID=A0A1C6ST87_9ACTN|nr:hypothetical protein [Micromonospora pallida]SCL32589.1 hypothetical protein GA0074692_3353 [Micromonospora pallida]